MIVLHVVYFLLSFSSIGLQNPWARTTASMVHVMKEFHDAISAMPFNLKVQQHLLEFTNLNKQESKRLFRKKLGNEPIRMFYTPCCSFEVKLFKSCEPSANRFPALHKTQPIWEDTATV